MKIAFIVHDYHRYGGHARYVAELASRFKKDHEVHVFASVWEEPDPDGITFHYVPSIRWSSLIGALTFILPATVIVGTSFDIVHSQGLTGFRHDISTAHFIQKKWISSLREKGKRIGITGWIWRNICAPLEAFALGPRCAKRVIAISKSVSQDLKNEYGRVEGVDLIYHGVDLTRFHPDNKEKWRNEVRAKLGISEKNPLALFVGNLQKGAAAAISAISKVCDAHLLLVSGSNNKYEKNLAENLGLIDRIHWVPLSREVEKYFACADCFVFPTLYEPYGMVISEAMASGIPVITSRIAGASELIIHRETGWLLEDPWDVNAIADGLRFFLSDLKNAGDIGLRARIAIEPYTWERCASETMDVYQAMIRDRNAAD